MKSNIKANTRILLICSIVTLLCSAFILYQVNTNLVDSLNIYQTDLTTEGYIVGFAILFILLFHIYALIYVLMHFRRFEELNTLKILLLILGIISLFSLGGEKVMVDDIAKQYRAGLSINELNMLNVFYIINALFGVGMFYFLLKTIKLVHIEDVNSTSIDERIFVLAQYLGIVSGIMGLLFVFHNIIFIDKALLYDKYWVLIPFYFMFVTPYGLSVLYWLSLKRKQKITDWYDEKQLQDVLKSSLTTLILSIPGIVAILFVEMPLNLYFLLYYLFMILLIFSGSTLYFFKLKDIH